MWIHANVHVYTYSVTWRSYVHSCKCAILSDGFVLIHTNVHMFLRTQFYIQITCWSIQIYTCLDTHSFTFRSHADPIYTSLFTQFYIRTHWRRLDIKLYVSPFKIHSCLSHSHSLSLTHSTLCNCVTWVYSRLVKQQTLSWNCANTVDLPRALW